MKISKLTTRFVIPFKIGLEKISFEDICKRVQEHHDDNFLDIYEINKEIPNKGTNTVKKINTLYTGLWELEPDTSAECDIYDYIHTAYTGSYDNLDSLEQEGCIWKYNSKKLSLGKESDNGLKNITLVYRKKNLDDESSKNINFNIEISSIKLSVFRTNIGFLSFGFNVDGSKADIVVDDIIEALDEIKELNYKKNKECNLFLKGEFSPVDGNNGIISKKNSLLPFHLGNWAASRLKFLQECDIQFFAERSNSFASSFAKYSIPEYAKQFVVEKVPDKPLIFHMGSFIDDTESHDVEKYKDIAFRMANGYSSKYNRGLDTEKDFINYFKDVIFYASSQGCGYFAFANDKSAQNTFDGLVTDHIRNYFTLYIKVLYQAFSILKFSEELSSNMLPFDYKDYIQETENHPEMVEDLKEKRAQINLFLIKNTTASVSHIHHHNVFYSQLEKAMSIREDIEALTDGLEALDEMQDQAEEKKNLNRDRGIQAAVSAIALLALWSALADSQGFVEKSVEWGLEFAKLFKPNVEEEIDYQKICDSTFWFIGACLMICAIVRYVYKELKIAGIIGKIIETLKGSLK